MMNKLNQIIKIHKIKLNYKKNLINFQKLKNKVQTIFNLKIILMQKNSL